MKKTSSNSDSFLDRIRSSARAHGPSRTLSRDPNRPSNSPLSSPQNSSAHTTTSQNELNTLPSIIDVVQQPDITSNDATGVASTVRSPPTTSPQADGQGIVIEPENEKEIKKHVVVRFWLTFRSIILSSYINWLLVFVPVGIAAEAAKLSPGIIFAMNAVAIVPLAGLLSHATESVAKRMGDTIGALMNVTFGNAVELIILYVLHSHSAGKNSC